MPDETMPDDRELLQQVIRALYRSEGNYLELRARMLDIHRVCTSVPAEGGGAKRVMDAVAALDKAWAADAAKAELRAERDRLKAELAQVESRLRGAPAVVPNE